MDGDTVRNDYEVAVIGAGLAGIETTIETVNRNPDVNVVLLEAYDDPTPACTGVVSAINPRQTDPHPDDVWTTVDDIVLSTGPDGTIGTIKKPEDRDHLAYVTDPKSRIDRKLSTIREHENVDIKLKERHLQSGV